MIRVLIWNEYRHEKCQPEVAKLYPQGMHAAIGEYLMQDEDIIVRLACLDDPEQGLSEEALAETDVLIWWGHLAHGEVDDALVERWGGRDAATIYARFIAGGIMHTYNMWILDDFDVSAETLAQTLCNILVNGIKAFEVK